MVITLVAFILVSAVYLISLLIKNFQPGKSKVEADINYMKSQLQLFINELIPWNKKELDLLSYNQVNQKISNGLIKSGQGVITSIYHEPMIAWAYKKYVGGGDNALLYAKTSHHEFIFRVRNNGTTIIIDGNEIGELRENGLLYGKQNNRLIARINRQGSQLALPVLIGDKEVATLKSKSYLDQTNKRAFELLNEMTDQEEALLLSFTILEITKEALPDS